MTSSAENKVALVTGAASGIGRAAAAIFAREGTRVVVADIDEQGGGEAVFVRVDVSSPEEVEGMVNAAIDAYGRLDNAFNNAGVEGTANVPAADYDEEVWDRVMDINLKGVWLCLKYEIPRLFERGGGAIVNTASTAGLRANAINGTAYIASKHGVVGLTRATALEYGPHNIRVNAVCPGAIHTPMAERILGADYRADQERMADHPSRRFGTLEEVAETVVWLCSDAGSYVTGHAMAVDGGAFAR